MVENIFGNYSDAVSSLGFAVRELVLQELPGVTETHDIPANMLAYGYGPGYKHFVCTIIPSKKGIKLGFYKGTELPDPAGVLAGSGKVHKYVEVKSMQDPGTAVLKELLHHALKACRMRTGQ